MFEWFKRKEEGFELIAKDNTKKLTDLNTQLQDYLKTLESIKQEDTDLYKEIKEKAGIIQDFLDASKALAAESDLKSIVKDYDKTLSGIKKLLEKLNKSQITVKEQAAAEQELAESLGTTVEDISQNTGDTTAPKSEQTTDTDNVINLDEQQLEKAGASLKEKLLKKNATDNGINLSEQTVKNKQNLEKATEILREDISEEEKKQKLKSQGLSTEGSYNMFLKQCFGSSEDILKQIEDEIAGNPSEKFPETLERIESLVNQL